MSYQSERDQFIAQMTREGLPIWATTQLLRAATGFNRRAEMACSSEAADRDRVKCPALRNKSERDIINEKFPCLCNYDHEAKQHTTITRITLQDDRAERRLIAMLAEVSDTCTKCGAVGSRDDLVGDCTKCGKPFPERVWSLLTAGDPRGYTLRVIPPSYEDRNAGKSIHNLDSIGVPARESGIRW